MNYPRRNCSQNRDIADVRIRIPDSEFKILFESLPDPCLAQNLISNALKFRKKDEQPMIRVSAEESANEWIVGVRDNGIGIEERFHDQVFEVFRRLHTREEYAGTGIGLALGKKIASFILQAFSGDI